jgi:hypothetical protein
MSDPLPLFSAVLLYDTPQDVPPRRHLVAQLNALLGDAEVTLGAIDTGEADLIALACEEALLEITFSDAAPQPDSFEAAIRSPYTRLSKIDFASRIKASGGSVKVSVTGPVGAARPEDPVLAVVLLHRAIGVILDLVDDEPEVIHWVQSDTLHTADAIRRTLAKPFPACLVSHPRYFTGAPGPTGRPSIGFEAMGSEVFCDSRLVAEPTTRNAGSLKALVDYLVEAYATGQIDLDDGAALPAGAAGTVRLTHERSTGDTPGRILVRIDSQPGGTATDTPSLSPDPAAAPPKPPGVARLEVPHPAPIAAPPPTFDRRPPTRTTLREPQAPDLDWEATDSAIALMLNDEPEPLATLAEPVRDEAPAAPLAAKPRASTHLAFSDPDNYSSQNIDAIGARAAAPALGLVPDTDPADATAPRPRPARRWLRAIWPRSLREVYTPDPEQSTVRHLAIAGLLFLVIPVLGFVLFVATLFRGPLPKLTALAVAVGLGSLAVQVIAGQAFAF